MYIKLLQLDTKHPNCFMDYQWAEQHGGVNLDDYKLVFEGEVDAEGPEAVYRTFNLNPPEGYHSRSMSVSDVLLIKSGVAWDKYFCDTIGFKHF